MAAGDACPNTSGKRLRGEVHAVLPYSKSSCAKNRVPELPPKPSVLNPAPEPTTPNPLSASSTCLKEEAIIVKISSNICGVQIITMPTLHAKDARITLVGTSEDQAVDHTEIGQSWACLDHKLKAVPWAVNRRLRNRTM